MARRARWIIYRPEQARFEIEKRSDVFLVPNMIAGRDHRHARAQKLDRDLPGNSATAGRVLTVDDRKIDRVLFLQLRQSRDDRLASRLANDVTQEKYR